jgi:hypothetical protein
MKPVTPVVPGFNLPVQTFAKDQPQYIPLPAVVCEDCTVVTRWKLSFAERLRVLFTGDIWHSQLTFGLALQPIRIETNCPIAPEQAELAELSQTKASA